jgi:hypothetical protein
MEDGKCSGKGILCCETGTIVGHFKDDYVDGYAIMYHKDGNIYEGQWTKGKKNGIGIFLQLSKSSDTFNIHGEEHDSNIRIKGVWENDSLSYITDITCRHQSPDYFTPLEGLLQLVGNESKGK